MNNVIALTIALVAAFPSRSASFVPRSTKHQANRIFASPTDHSRRDVLENALLSTILVAGSSITGPSLFLRAANAYDGDLLVDVPMIRLTLPRGVYGRE